MTIPAPDFDYPLRYAAWRAIALAKDRDPLTGQAWRILPMESSGSTIPDVLLQNEAGERLETVTCREYQGVIPFDAIRDFLDSRRPLLASGKGSPARFRFVSDSRLIQIAPGERLWDFGDPLHRRDALAACGLDSLGSEVIWDVGSTWTKMALTATSLVYLAHTEAGDDRALYLLLYSHLLTELAQDSPDRRAETFPYALLLDLYGSTVSRPEPTPGEPANEGLNIPWLRAEIFPRKPETTTSTVSSQEIAQALRRGLFGETQVSLADIYVSQKATLTMPIEEKNLSYLWEGRTLDLMFRWLAESRSNRRKRHPLLVLGSFGSGKSSLLTEFAQELLQNEESIVPLLIPLRDLRGATPSRPITAVLAEHIRRRWGLDIEASHPLGICYCLLCDGFDELNLYYRAIDSDRWVSECFRSLSLLAEREGLHVVISSRPILMMDVRQRSYEGGFCPNLFVELFDQLEIDQWCLNYRRAAGLPEFLDSDFLAERNLLEVARTPLVLYMLARLFELEDTSLRARRPYSRAEIYRSFVDWTCRGGYYREEVKHDVPPNYREILREIGWFFFRTGDGFVAEERLLAALYEDFGDHAPGRVPIDRNILVAHMLQPVDIQQPSVDNLVEFTHQSFREYLVAERIWSHLRPARRGEGLDASTWIGFSHKAFSSSEIDFLADLAGELAWDEAQALYLALENTDNVHQYWIKWLAPVWDRLRTGLSPAEIEKAHGAVGITASRTCILATLGFLLRVKCFARLSTLAREEQGRELPAPPSADLLSRLLHLLAAFPDLGLGGDNRSLLLQNLQGLVLAPGSSLESHRLEALSLQDAVLAKVRFSGCQWSDADLRGADFTGARFDRCWLQLAATDHTSFRSVSLADAVLTHSESKPITGADFTGADFERVRLLDLTVIDCRFVNNRWSSATHYRTAATKQAGLLIRCELDDDAERFFAGQGFVLERCRRI